MYTVRIMHKVSYKNKQTNKRKILSVPQQEMQTKMEKKRQHQPTPILINKKNSLECSLLGY